MTPPGPRPRPILGNLPGLAQDPLCFFTRCARDYGDIVSLRLMGWRAILVSHPDLIEAVLVANHGNFVKHRFFWRHVSRMFGTGLLTSDGDLWRRRRKVIAPAFQAERIAGYAPVMVDYARRQVASWRDGERRDLYLDMKQLLMAIVAKVLFDADIAAQVAEAGAAVDRAAEEVAQRFRRPVLIPDWVPIPGNRRYLESVRRIDGLIYRIIHERRGDVADRTDLLSQLMTATDGSGNPMNDRQLRDELVTLLLAGHETTALALAWTGALLTRHPAAQARIHAEVDEVLQGRPATVADVPSLGLTRMAVMEAMRLYPPVYAFGREAVTSCRIGGYPVAAGTTVFMSPWVVHRDSRFFEAPESFDMDRWQAEAAERPRFAYFPFGGGPRICLGHRFAMMEAVLVLATVLQQNRLAAACERLPEPYASITLRPRGGVPVTVHRR